MRKRELVLIERIKKLEDTIRFLSKYDREKIVLKKPLSTLSNIVTHIEYLYNGELKIAEVLYTDCEIVKNENRWFIGKGNGVYENDIYFKVVKATAEVHIIPKPAFVLEQELAEKEKSAKKEKESGNKKRTKVGEQAK